MPEKIISSRTAFSGHFRVRQDTIRTGARISTRDIVEYPSAVAMIAVDNNDKIILERQYRHAAGRDLLEIPAGGIDPGETPEAAACREMQEETGYRPRRVEKLTNFYSAPGYSTELLHLFLVKDLVEDRLTAEDSEEITLVTVSQEEALKLIAGGQIIDGKSIAGLLFYFNLR
ncbi:NUDIX hydrolase [Dehalogenimonas sp. 4OHTPN]|uniref:NUDIX hydrolase n=1 Tax=Dehalogenimonas sp. 4OHTPN TaxID=3166643 RepID=A0AAU8G9L4_9CHLR